MAKVFGTSLEREGNCPTIRQASAEQCQLEASGLSLCPAWLSRSSAASKLTFGEASKQAPWCAGPGHGARGPSTALAFFREALGRQGGWLTTLSGVALASRGLKMNTEGTVPAGGGVTSMGWEGAEGARQVPKGA